MFEKSIEIISNAFLQYKGNGMYMALFLLGMLYIYLNEKDKKMRCLFLYFPLATLFVTLNPLFNKCVGKIFTGSVYWRLFWILPIGITIAYCLIKFVQDQKEKSQKIIVDDEVTLVDVNSTDSVKGKVIFKHEYESLENLIKSEGVRSMLPFLKDDDFEKALQFYQGFSGAELIEKFGCVAFGIKISDVDSIENKFYV